MPKETIKPLKDHLADMKAAKKKQADIEREIGRIGKAIIDMCPKKKGDIVTVNSGWSHMGKQMSITRIAFDPTDQKYKFDGLVLRGDGSVGKFQAKAAMAVK